MRIGLKKIHLKVITFPVSDKIEWVIRQYNSTLEDHQVLQPLPSEMPEWFNEFHGSYLMWNKVIQHYGTPTKKELVSVGELAVELEEFSREANRLEEIYYLQAQHIIDTYSLHPPKREWWMDCEKFVYNGKVIDCHGYNVERSGLISLYNRVYGAYTLSDCTPYIEPSTIDICKEKLGAELFEKLMKEVKG